VNTAQRLQSLASPGDVLVGPLTHRLSRHAFSYDSLGDLSFRGKVGSVLVHRLLGPLDAPRAARGLETLGLSAPLIGRDSELARMLGSLSLACGGAVQLVRLIGEAGIGKTRLVNEFIARVGEDDRFESVAVRRVTCSPLGEQSYGALAAVLRSAYGIAHKASAAEAHDKLIDALTGLGLAPEEAERLMPFYFHVLGLGDPDAVLQHLEPEQLRRQMFFAIRTLFERRLAVAPLLIIVEDLHWADAVSLETLHLLIDRLERKRLMLLFTHRPLPEMDRIESSRISHATLRLAPLSLAEGEKLLAAFFGDDWVSSIRDLGNRILRRAGGNPLYVEEIVRGLIERGALEREGSQWRVTGDEAAADIPASIQAMLLARVDRMPHDVRRLAQEAAVLGPQFDSAFLKVIAGDSTQVEADLDLLCDSEIVEEVAGGNSTSSQLYRFTQTLLQDVIYQNLLVQRRTEMHGRIGVALERLSGEAPERLEDLVQLGHHFSLSADKAKGARYLMAAGDRARAIFANDDAIRHYQQALQVLASAGHESELLVLCERIADLSGPAGRREAAHEHYNTVLKSSRSKRDRVAEARILRKLGRLLWDAGKRNEAEAHYAEAARLLGTDAPPIEQAHLLHERGRLAFRIGDHAAAARWADEALGHAQSATAGADIHTATEAARAIAEALNTKGVALARLGQCSEAVREVERSVAVAEAAGLLSTACRGYTNLGALYTTIDPARAIEVCRRGLEVAGRIGDLGFQARLLANLAVACCTFTDKCADEGVPAAEKAIELDRALDQHEHLPVPLIVLGQIHQCHGQPKLAARCYEEALGMARETGEPQLLFPCYDGLATLNLDLDNLAEAERFFALAQDVCRHHKLDPAALVVLPFLD